MYATPAKLQFARQLRRESTDAERLLWFHLRDRRIGVKFRRQQPVGPFIVDFLSVEAMLIVELDGSQHHEAVDTGRTRFLERRGYRVLRFWNHDVLVRTESVLEVILASVALTPTPLPAGEGLKRAPNCVRSIRRRAAASHARDRAPLPPGEGLG